MSASDLDGRSAALARAFRDQGITSSLSGEKRVFPELFATHRVRPVDANANAVEDDKLLYAHVPELVRYCLGEELALRNVDTHRLTDPDELAVRRTQVAADPRGWIAQRGVRLWTSHTQIGDRLVPRHVDLRPCAVNDGDKV